VAEELPEDFTLVLEALSNIRIDARYIIDLLEEDDGEEETENV
jgi:hypothetical protein